MKSYQDKQKISDRCEHHAEKLIKYYCQDHSQLGCSQCFITKHRQCSDVVYIADFAIDECQEIKTVEKKLSKLKDDTNRNEQEKIKNQDRVHQHHNRIIADVSDHADKLVNMIRRLEQEKLAELDKTKQTELHKLENVDTLNSSVEDGLSKLKTMFDASKDNNRLMFITMKHIQKEVPLLDSTLNQSMGQNMFAEQEFALSPELVKVLDRLTELGSMKNPQLKEMEKSTHDDHYEHNEEFEVKCTKENNGWLQLKPCEGAVMEISSSYDIELLCVLLNSYFLGQSVSCCLTKDDETLMFCTQTCLVEGNHVKIKLNDNNSVVRLIANQRYLLRLERNTIYKGPFIFTESSLIPEIIGIGVHIGFSEKSA